MKKVEFHGLSMRLDERRTKLYYVEYIPEDKTRLGVFWRSYCKTMPEAEKTFFNMLCINPECCVPETEKPNYKKSFLPVGCVFCIFGELEIETKIRVGRFAFTLSPSDGEGVVEVRAYSKHFPLISGEAVKKPRNPITALAYKKAVARFDVQSKLAAQKALVAKMRSLHIKYIPLSESETATYRAVWSEVFDFVSAGGDKKRSSGLVDFFEGDSSAVAIGEKARKQYDSAQKMGCTILFDRECVGVKCGSAVQLKSQSIAGFNGLIVTAGDFAWTCCVDDEKFYFYRNNKGEKK